MKLHMIAVGQKMPDWVMAGIQSYQRRMPAHLPIIVREIPAEPRPRQSTGNADRLMAAEADRIRQAIPDHALTVAMEVSGAPWSTESLAERFAEWMQSGQDICFVIGGPDGIDPDLSRTCQTRWSLGALTLPHPLVRVIIAEQLYRAHTILTGHPYHRG